MYTAQQGIVASLTVILFVCMAMEKFTPEVLFMAALVVITFCEILTLEEALSGENQPLTYFPCIFLSISLSPTKFTCFKQLYPF